MCLVACAAEAGTGGAPESAAPAAAAAPAPPGAVQLGALDWVMLAAGPLVVALIWAKGWLRLPSPARAGVGWGTGGGGGGRDLSGMPALVWLLSAVMLFFAPSLGFGVVLTLPARLVGAPGTLRLEAMKAIGAYTVGLATAAFLLYVLRRGASPASGLRARWGDIPRALLALALALPIVSAAGTLAALVYTLIRHQPPEAISHQLLRQIHDHADDPWAWGLTACAVIGAPIVEELEFRVFLQSALLRALRRPWPAILITAALFAAMHIGAVEPHTLPILFVLGVSLGVAYERTRRLGVPIVMHAAFNLANVLLALGTT